MTKFIILHLIISIIYFIYAIHRTQKNQAIIELIWVLVIPVLGVLSLVFIRLFAGWVRGTEDLLERYNFYLKESLDKEAVLVVQPQKEVNTVSIEEALVYNNDKEKRELLFDVLKGDYWGNISILKSALKDEDTETSHYAASALMRIKSKLDDELQLIEIEYEYNKEDIKVLNKYVSIIKTYIESDLLDEFTYKKYSVIYIDLLKGLLSMNVQYREYYEEVINYALKKENYQVARSYCESYLQTYPGVEEPHLLAMKLSYQLMDKEKLIETFNTLINSSIVLSPRGLSIIRFWLKDSHN